MAMIQTEKSLYFSKNDPNDPRLGDWAQAWSTDALNTLTPGGYTLIGYPDDAGIRLSGGRLGAISGPTSIRRFLYKMTPSVLSQTKSTAIYDLGNLLIEPEAALFEEELLRRHELAKSIALQVLRSNNICLSLGGGHDYGYPDAAAFALWCKDVGVRPLLINFDAHLDVRPFKTADKKIRPSSGTPFSRYLTEFPESDFLEIGLQGQCNSAQHLQWLYDRGGRTLFVEEAAAAEESFVALVSRKMDDWLERRRPCFISVDIDVFSDAFAPGCSQSFAQGLTPREFFPLFDFLLSRLQVKGCGIYETAPPLDLQDQTSKLAACILHRVLQPI